MKYLTLLFMMASLLAKAQILNAYAKISNLNGARTTLTVTNVNETSHTFAVGGQVVVMQMQDDVIGSNTGNNAAFGNLGSIASTGLYDIRTIGSRSPAVGTPTAITLSSPLINTYNTGANSSLQYHRAASAIATIIRPLAALAPFDS